MSQLAALGAVLFVRKEPPTLVLDPELRDQLRGLLDGASTPGSEEIAEPQRLTTSSTDRAAYALLEVAPSASLEEVRAAYRKK